MPALQNRGISPERRKEPGPLQILNRKSHYFTLLFSGRGQSRKCFSP